MPWALNKAGTPAQVITAVNAMVSTDQSAAANAQLVRAKAIIIAEINAVGGTFIELQSAGTFYANNSSIDVQVGPVPFVNASGEQSTELSPNTLP